MPRNQKREAVAFDEALAIIRNSVDVLESETVAVIDALGRTLAHDALAAYDYPAFDMSAMDGYAFRSSDTALATGAVPTNLVVGRSIFAGDGPTRETAGGRAFGIATGAPMPAGCDAVLAQERCELHRFAGRPVLSIDDPVMPFRNVRRRGEDARQGDAVAMANDQITAAMIGAFACYGISELSVRHTPAVSILTTGDELSTGVDDAHGRVQDGNGPMLIASCRSAGLMLRSARTVGDRLGEINAAFDEIIVRDSPDIILTTGGVSAGTRDLIPEVLASRGAVIGFHGVRMRPGKPVLFGRLPSGQLVFGLPGNPVAALLGFRFLVMEAAHAMLGVVSEQGVRIAMDDDAARPGATVFSKARVSYTEEGARIVEKLPGQQSHLMRPLIRANAWLRTPPRGESTGSTYLHPMMPDRIPI